MRYKSVIVYRETRKILGSGREWEERSLKLKLNLAMMLCRDARRFASAGEQSNNQQVVTGV